MVAVVGRTLVAVRARAAAVEARPGVCFAVRELDAVVLDEAGLTALDAAVLDATAVLEVVVLDEAGLEAALDGLALCAAGFEAVVLAAADLRGCVRVA